jgi:serine/threonine protein kinase
MRLGDYELIERIGSGGMAEVYRARQLTAFGREVALKVVRAGLSENEEFRARFLREAQAISRLSHPNILPLIEFGDEDGTLYLVTPLVRGGTLRDLLKQHKGALPLGEAGPLFLPLCNAVQYAHEEGIIHRDIKPQNILLQQHNHVLLADFGIARDRNAAQITSARSGIGTVDYMAPEQAVGQADARSDIYSLGVLLYQMLTGHLPYEGSTPLHVLARHSSEPLPDPRAFNPALTPSVVEILQTAMAKQPDERFQSASALGNAVQQVIDASASRSRPGFPSAASSPDLGAGQPDRPPGISVSLPSIDSTSAEQASIDILETRPEPGFQRSLSGPEGRPPGISIPLPATNNIAPGQPATPYAPPVNNETQPAHSPPATMPGNPPTQPTYLFGAPPGYQSPGMVGSPPAPYLGGPMPPAPKHRRTGLIIMLGLLALVLVVGGIGLALVKVLQPGSSASTGHHAPTPTPTIPPGFRLYTDPNHTFRIIYPSSWQQQPSPLGSDGMEFDGPRSQMFTAINEGSAQPGDVGATNDNFCTGYSGATNPQTTVTIGGQRWSQEACDAFLGLGHGVSESIVYKGNLYLLVYTDEPESFNSDNTQYFARMEQSFTFLT